MDSLLSCSSRMRISRPIFADRIFARIQRDLDGGDRSGRSVSPPKDFSGNSPFDGAWFTSPDAAYWAHQDSVIQQAAANGIAVFLQTSPS